MRLVAACLLPVMLLLCGCAMPPAQAPAASARVVGGVAFRSMAWQVRVALPPGVDEIQLQRELQGELDALDAALSTWRDDSGLMRFNRAPVGEWVPVSPALLDAVRTALAVSELTQGAYDVTVGPLVELWGFGATPAPPGLPDAAALAAARSRVGWQHVAVDGTASRLMRRQDVRLDLSSLGEGAAVDALAARLERAGIRDYLVSVAGTSRAAGRRPDGSAWMLGLERPDGSGLAARRLALADQVVSTSGAYRNYRDIDGRRLSHTIDPATGHPVSHRGVSVTVIQPAGTGAMRCDALATAFNVLGPDRGLALAERLGLPVLYVEEGGSGFAERASAAFRPRLAD